jgi:hypothetical protein
MRYRLVIAVSAVALATALGAADAAVADDSVVTFDVTSGSLTITVPAAANLGAEAPGNPVVGQIGNISVTDNRAAADASWTAEVKSTDFTTGAGGAGHVIAADQVTYSAGTATSTTGDGAFNAGPVGILDTATLRTAFSHVGGTGNNAATWNPTLTIAVAVSNVAGVYSGTVTHSVA